MTQARSTTDLSSDPGSLGDQGRATLASEIRPEPLALHAQAPLLLRQGEDVDERPHEKCREDDARISWSKASGDWGQVIPKMPKDKEIVVGTSGIFGTLKPKRYFQPYPHPKPKRGTEAPCPSFYFPFSLAQTASFAK
jgi:hypothetical protein